MQIQKQLDKSESSRSITAHLTAAQGILLHIFIWPAGVGLFYSIECGSICYFNNECNLHAAASLETIVH
jgi:hypothetical protein